MAREKQRRGVSKGEWLEAGLEALSAGSVDRISVEGLAGSLGIAKSGFYWHFRSREEVLKQLLDYWYHEVTEVVTENAKVRALGPRSCLTKTAEMLFDFDLVRYEIGIRQWALGDAVAARAVRRVDRTRLDFIGTALSELGFTGDDLEVPAMLFVSYQTWESSMFREISRKRRRQLIGSASSC